MERVKNQHYVPGFILRRFCFAGEQLYVYDKPTKRVFRSSVANVANENGFYDLPPGHVMGTQGVEKAFADFEGKAATAMSFVLNQVEEQGWFESNDLETRKILSLLVALNDSRSAILHFTCWGLKTSRSIGNCVGTSHRILNA